MLPANRPISEPSFGDTLNSRLAAFMLPAPGMLWTTMLGWPGM